MKYKKHKHGRNVRDFEPHRMERQQGELRKGRPWRFYHPGKVIFNPAEPHFRAAARTPALPGKHVRRVEERMRAAHARTM